MIEHAECRCSALGCVSLSVPCPFFPDTRGRRRSWFRILMYTLFSPSIVTPHNIGLMFYFSDFILRRMGVNETVFYD